MLFRSLYERHNRGYCTMKVALFGGTGFVGTYITEELLNNNHDPVLLVRPGSENKVYLPDKCHVNIGDITDFESIEQTTSTTRNGIVIKNNLIIRFLNVFSV